MFARFRPAHLAAALGTTLALAIVGPPQAAAQTPFRACKEPRGYQCGRVIVPIDRSATVPGTISLNVVRRTKATPTPTAVVALAGGPGQAAVPITETFATELKPALATRDLLVFDQRGTGRSGPLACKAFERDDESDLASTGRTCANQIGAGRRFYTTNDSALDLEALRVATGYDKLTIYGVSYGTKVALAYAALFPTRVERLVLDSVVTPEGPDPLQRTAFAAMPRILKELCSGGDCRGITADPVGDLRALVRRMQGGSVPARIVLGGGQTVRVPLGRQDLLNVLFAGDLDPTLRAELPGSLAAARRGDEAPIGRLIARANGATYRQADGDEAFSDTLHAATTCEELPFPWAREADARTRDSQLRAAIASLAPSVFFPFDRTTARESVSLALCGGWPTPTPAPTLNSTLPAVPTLVLNGHADLRTPLEDALAVAARIPGTQTAAVPFTGHSVLGSESADEKCAERAVKQFFTDQAVSPCTNTDNTYSPTPRPPATMGSVKPLRGTSGRRGRTIAAAAATATDMRRQLLGILISNGESPRGIGGLRGGRSVVNRESAKQRLIRVRYVNGVSVSGTVTLSGAANLQISGGGALTGRVRISTGGFVIRATFGGRTTRVVNAASASRTGLGVQTLAQARQFYERTRAARR